MTRLSSPIVQIPIKATKNPNAETFLNHSTEESDGDEFWPLSEKPYCHMVLAKSHVLPLTQLCLPTKMRQILPSETVPTVLNYHGKSWEMLYLGDSKNKRFDHGWHNFVVDNDLKVGDACVFQLTDLSSTTKVIKFKVQILRGDFPAELVAKLEGETPNVPIIIE